jgi:hypothetical protein
VIDQFLAPEMNKPHVEPAQARGRIEHAPLHGRACSHVSERLPVASMTKPIRAGRLASRKRSMLALPTLVMRLMNVLAGSIGWLLRLDGADVGFN